MKEDITVTSKAIGKRILPKTREISTLNERSFDDKIYVKHMHKQYICAAQDMCKKHNKNNKTKSRLYGFNRTLFSVCGHFAHEECAVKKIYYDYEEHVPEQDFFETNSGYMCDVCHM